MRRRLASINDAPITEKERRVLDACVLTCEDSEKLTNILYRVD
jgi:nuclear transport factor 2 (NTF2) superfamily protein